MTLFDEIQKMIDDSMSRPYFENALRRANSDVTETKDEIIVTIELPGVDKKDINVEASEDTISVTVESKKKSETKKEGFYKAGSRYFNFSANYATPAVIDPKTVSASYLNGVLEVSAKKIKTEKSGVKVAVK